MYIDKKLLFYIQKPLATKASAGILCSFHKLYIGLQGGWGVGTMSGTEK